MIPLKSIFPTLAFLLGFGCASRAIQTENLLLNSESLPKKVWIQNVNFINQSEGYCGPATLTMALNWAGHEASVTEVAALVYTPGLSGTTQADMISAVRRRGMFATPLHKMKDLFSEVAAGNPVIIFENLSLSWFPKWHYALVVGFDLESQKIVMHSGPDENYHWDLKKFERSWMLGEYWGLVVLQPGQLSASGTELQHASAAVGLQQAGQIAAAEKSFLKILERWPQSLVASIGLSEILYNRGEAKKAATILRKAQKFHPESEALRHNLTVAEKN